MRFYQLLRESDYSVPVTKEQAMEYLTTTASDAWTLFKKGGNRKCLYKGMGDHGDYAVMTPDQEVPHGAAHTDNIHYNLMKIIPEWSKIPDRTHALDMTTDISYAGGYGDRLYRCFAPNGTVYAYVDVADFWSVTSPNIDIGGLNFRFYNDLLEVPDVAGSEPSKRLRRKVMKPDQVKATIRELVNYSEVQSDKEFVAKKIDDYIDILKKAAKNVHLTTNIRDIPDDVEVWTNSSLLAVEVDAATDLPYQLPGSDK